MNPNYPENDFIIKWDFIANNQITSVKNHTCIHYKGNLIFFGGYDNKKNSNNVYSFSIANSKFTKCSCTGSIPKPRNGHTSTVIFNKMIMIGGWLGEEELASDEVYQLYLDSFQWTKLNPQPSIGPSNMHTSDLYKEIIYIFRGGNGSAFLNDLIAYDITKNSTELIYLTGKIPSRRANHMSSIVDDFLYIFGGWSGHTLLNDLFCINLITRTSSEVHTCGIRPSFRAGARIVSNGNYLILFGGFKGNSIYLNDVHFFDFEKNYWFSSGRIVNHNKTPSSRAGHSMTIVNERFIYILGGSANASYFNGIYLLEIDLEPEIYSESPSIMHNELIKSNFKNLFNNFLLSDVDIIIENKIIKGHKFILSLSSAKFENMFSVNMKENYTVTITHFKYVHFEVFLKFLYSGELLENEIDFDNISSIPKESNDEISLMSSFVYFDQRSQNTQIVIHSWGLLDYLELLWISDEYYVNDLKIWCEKTITNFITYDNYSMIVAFANKFNCNNLLKYLDWYYSENKTKVKIEELTLMTFSS